MIEICRELPDEEYVQRVLGLIRAHGWAVEHIRKHDGRKAIASTFGLCLRGHPEFVVFGCDAFEGFTLLEPLALAVQSGRRFLGGDDLSGHYARPEQFELLDFPLSAPYLPTVNELFRRDGTAPIPAMILLKLDQLGGTGGQSSADEPTPDPYTTHLVGAAAETGAA